MPTPKSYCPVPIRPANGPLKLCGVSKRQQDVMCYRHWKEVPQALRDTIWRLYLRARGSTAHVAAIREAIEVVSDITTPRTEPIDPAR